MIPRAGRDDVGIPRSTLESKIRALKINKSDRPRSSPVASVVVQHFAIGEISPTDTPLDSFGFNTFAGKGIALGERRGAMLKIQRRTNGDVVFTLSGRLKAENASELSALLAAEPAGRTLVLDLKDVVLVDREIVRFLRACEGDGIELRNCPAYIREWIARGEGQR